MQKVNLDKYPNASGWKVVHDPDQGYLIASDKGRTLNVKYTDRRFAEVALDNYLRSLYEKDHRRQAKNTVKKQSDNTEVSA